MRKALRNYHSLSRLAIASYMRQTGLTQTGKFILLRSYLPWNILKWGTSVMKYWFGKKHPFPVDPNGATYTADSTFTVCMTGDWASGTEESAKVAFQMSRLNPDYTIHLGDVYYVGDEKEAEENFIGVPTDSSFAPVQWPVGRKGSFALPGNHEMYANGNGFYDRILPWLKQPTSYFCLQNEYWRVIGLDTGYNSTGWHPDAHLPDEIIEWLRTLKLQEDPRHVVLLTHHNPLSAFETSYPKVAAQLNEFFRSKPVIWFWGHEHRMAVYEEEFVNGVDIIGRCIGHGGMPVKLKEKKTSPLTPICIFTDKRKYLNLEGLDVGYNGFAYLTFSGTNLYVQYKDLNGVFNVYAERF